MEKSNGYEKMSKTYGLEDENGCMHLGFSGSIKVFALNILWEFCF